MPNSIDWARLAALIDGEGCIDITTYKPPQKGLIRNIRYQSRVTVYNTDPRLIAWMINTFGVGSTIARGPRPRSSKPAYEWTVSGSTCGSILSGCLPYFIIKREQAEVVLRLQATMQRRGGGRGAETKVTPPSVLAEREDCLNQLRLLKSFYGHYVTNDDLKRGHIPKTAALTFISKCLSGEFRVQ